MEHIRRAWRDLVPLTAATLALAFLSLTVVAIGTGQPLPGQPLVNALAYNCPSNWLHGQKDAFNTTKHGWLGYCNNGALQFLYYAGEDDAGAKLTSQTLHLRDWNCGNSNYDQTLTVYGKTIHTMTIPSYTDWCGILEADVSGNEKLTGKFDWSFYLNY